jgi:phosphonoacetate hydrolase
MNDKSKADGTPNVIWLQDILDGEFGKGDTRVICPITDAFVAHHGALGGFVRVYCRGGNATPKRVMQLVEPIPEIEAVFDKQTVCRRFDLPPDREGDVAVISRADACVGGAAAEHDLSGLAGHRLRTHGGISEARVPFVLSEPVSDAYRAKAKSRPLNSNQIFDFALNGVAA